MLVVGSLPGAIDGKPVHRDIARVRAEVRDGIAATLEYARKAGMPLAIEPLHPMQAAERACINTLEQALDVCDALDPARSGALGVAVDLYHVWWDPKLALQIARAGRERLLAFHVCDWLTPTRDLLNDRGMMGDGVIEIRKARGWVEAAGYTGYSEVEIFSDALVGTARRGSARHLHRAALQRRVEPARPSATQRSGGECSSTMASSPTMRG